MTQYRMFLATILAAFILTACSGGKDDMKTENKAAEATTEQAAEQTDSATTEDANKAETATQETTQEAGTTETQQTTN